MLRPRFYLSIGPYNLATISLREGQHIGFLSLKTKARFSLALAADANIRNEFFAHTSRQVTDLFNPMDLFESVNRLTGRS